MVHTVYMYKPVCKGTLLSPIIFNNMIVYMAIYKI